MIIPISGDRNPSVASCWTSKEKPLIWNSWTFTLYSQAFSLFSLSLFPVLFPFSWETWRGRFPLFLRAFILDIICQGRKKKIPLPPCCRKIFICLSMTDSDVRHTHVDLTIFINYRHELSIIPKNFPWALMKGWTVKMPSFFEEETLL